MTMLGPVMLDIQGLALTDDDKKRLQHPLCGGVILFARNFESLSQLRALTAEIKALRRPQLLVAVDQEGGRVQRFREGFLDLPPIRQLGLRYDESPQQGLMVADSYGWLMAAECLAAGVDFSFAPVLDLDYGHSQVIGDRAFHSDPDKVIALATAYIKGMRRAGMVAVGKHFPGHGYVTADSHEAQPVDHRAWEEINARDLQPFRALVPSGLAGIMPAHVIYDACDSQAAGFSSWWLQHVLRQQLGFDGVIFSDDLSMQAAHSAGTPAQRAQAAFAAGCDMLLVCNDPDAADAVLASLTVEDTKKLQNRFEKLRGQLHYDWEQLHLSSAWSDALSQIT
ncbi:MAG TPA: beta-N-acetylhexosaminidase [Gammaproteobacteria bacterium]|nr:beta-N-acetylhexosaminidase [Gammaproteobacteria bacterium]